MADITVRRPAVADDLPTPALWREGGEEQRVEVFCMSVSMSLVRGKFLEGARLQRTRHQADVRWEKAGSEEVGR
ncbi:hypothetical protein ACFQ2A_00335 [Variovorax dokdonensis]|uniref:hypothetical protein n=1 Tax=Variovorax dokdonensis TaxID=344883 RepID=UPI003631A7E5